MLFANMSWFPINDTINIDWPAEKAEFVREILYNFVHVTAVHQVLANRVHFSVFPQPEKIEKKLLWNLNSH